MTRDWPTRDWPTRERWQAYAVDDAKDIHQAVTRALSGYHRADDDPRQRLQAYLDVNDWTRDYPAVAAALAGATPAEVVAVEKAHRATDEAWQWELRRRAKVEEESP